MTYLERHDDAENVHRYYAVEVTCDLFGCWVVVRRWGRLGSPNGRAQWQAVDTQKEAHDIAHGLRKAKLKRGYVAE